MQQASRFRGGAGADTLPGAEGDARKMALNLPNQITIARLGITLVLFVLLSLFQAEGYPASSWWLKVCFWLFLVAALMDVLDGLLARWLNATTPFGRIADPVVDKVMIGGAFLLFAGPNFIRPDGESLTSVYPLMVIVILLREFLVSAIRAYGESRGYDFGANWAGKLKMVIQSATVCLILGQLGWQLEALQQAKIGAVWLTVVVTLLSIFAYIRKARHLLLMEAETEKAAAAAERRARKQAGGRGAHPTHAAAQPATQDVHAAREEVEPVDQGQALSSREAAPPPEDDPLAEPGPDERRDAGGSLP